MSFPAILFAVYFSIGLLSMVAAVATRGKEKRATCFDVTGGSKFDAELLIFIALLWPLWLFSLRGKDDGPGR